MRNKGVLITLAGVIILSSIVVLAFGFNTPSASAASRYEVSVWYPGWGTSGTSDLEMVRQQSANINEVNPYWYKLNTDGTIGKYEWAERTDIINLAKEKSIRMRPLVTNEFDGERVSRMLATSTSRSAHAAKLKDLVVRNGYEGLDLDYEGLKPTDRDRFSEFVRVLANKLHNNGKNLSIAVMSKNVDSQHYAFDYYKLGRYADQVKIMTYDMHWNGSQAGPASSPEWIDSVYVYAKSKISPGKIRMGVPFYGREWIGTTAKDYVYTDVKTLIDTYNPTIHTHATGEKYFYYTKDGIQRTVYFQTPDSIGRKLDVLVNKHPTLGGISIWHIGGEDPAYWDVIRSKLFAL